MIPGVCRHLGDWHVDPSHPCAAYAGFEAIPDGFERHRVAADRRFPASGRFYRAKARMADARDCERDLLRPAGRDHVAIVAKRLSTMADGLPLVRPLYGLSDAQTEFHILDRRSFWRFLDLDDGDNTPDETTSWRFREALVRFCQKAMNQTSDSRD